MENFESFDELFEKAKIDFGDIEKGIKPTQFEITNKALEGVSKTYYEIEFANWLRMKKGYSPQLEGGQNQIKPFLTRENWDDFFAPIALA